MFLADKASDDGSGIWCSKGTIQRHTELGETTVKRTIREFLKEGILIETGARGCKNGFTVVYRINLARIETLEPTLYPSIDTGATVDPVHTDPGTGARIAGVRGSPRPPNNPKTIQKPPSREQEAVENEKAEQILAAYPPDKLRAAATCTALIKVAFDAGVCFEDLLQSVKDYADETIRFTRSKVCFSDNWFRTERWRSYVDNIATNRKEQKETEAEILVGLAKWVKRRHPLCRHITAVQIDDLLSAQLVTRDQIQAAGLRS